MAESDIIKILELSTRRAEQKVEQMGILISQSLDAYYSGDTKVMLSSLRMAEDWRSRLSQNVSPLIYSFEKELPERLR